MRIKVIPLDGAPSPADFDPSGYRIRTEGRQLRMQAGYFLKVAGTIRPEAQTAFKDRGQIRAHRDGAIERGQFYCETVNPHCFCSISICFVMRMAFCAYASVTEPLFTVLSFSGLTAAQR